MTRSTRIDRRTFLELGSKGIVVVGAGGAGALLAACDPGALATTPDANGLLLPPGFTSRIIATSGETVPGTTYVWHADPDGGAVFATAGGGWVYVSNSETGSGQGGVGYVEFDSAANVISAGSCLTGTSRNCGGGSTPWGTWLSGEETSTGQMWECDPLGATAGAARPGMGRFNHEAAACDEVEERIYLTEDRSSGGLYRFTPSTWGDLSAGLLEVMTESGGTLGWAEVPDPDGSPVSTRFQVASMKTFNGGEGIVVVDRSVIFTTKGDNRVWSYDIDANTITVMYDVNVSPNAILSGVDNVAATANGTVFVAEDGGDMQIVLVREDGTTFPVVELPGVSGSEITGPAFTTDGQRMYFSSQRNPGRTYEVAGNWAALTA